MTLAEFLELKKHVMARRMELETFYGGKANLPVQYQINLGRRGMNMNILRDYLLRTQQLTRPQEPVNPIHTPVPELVPIQDAESPVLNDRPAVVSELQELIEILKKQEENLRNELKKCQALSQKTVPSPPIDDLSRTSTAHIESPSKHSTHLDKHSHALQSFNTIAHQHMNARQRLRSTAPAHV